MSEMNDNVAVLGDWMPLSPSSNAFVSAPLGDYCDSQLNAGPSDGSRKSGFILDSPEHIASADTTKKDMAQWEMCSMEMAEGSSFSEQKSSRGGLVERMAARAGFNAPRLNTESIKSSGLSINTEFRSPYLTIPPGLSPTTLLESPILLSNVQDLPSPTTGQFPLVQNDDNKGSVLMSEAFDKSRDNIFEDIDSSTFAFKPAADSGALYLDQTNKEINSASYAHKSFPSTEVSVQTVNKSQLSEQTKNMFQWSTQDVNGINNVAGNKRLNAASGNAAKSPSMDEQQDEGDQKGNGDSGIAVAAGAPSEDGYNWRKYGQKQVKGSEYPRSYYKCTHSNCLVKKKVERSHEGHITEIIYKGNHNHPKPLPNRRTAIGSSSNLLDLQLDFPEQGRQHSDANGNPSWVNMQKGNTTENPEMGNDNMEVTSSAAINPEFCYPNGKQSEPGDTVDVSSTFSNDEDDDLGTHGSVSLAYDGEGDESESKRRKLEASAADMSGATRSFREPRVVVQTTSDVDILDDGYRWRKYGQKVVKGNPNPRSYYKCTSPGCMVRKHVERASNDLKSVITTYEGKHNHEVPAARNSNHVNSSAAVQMNQAAAAAAAAQSNVQRAESSQVQSTMSRFDRPSFNSFGLPGRSHFNPSPGFSFGMNQGLANMHMAGLGSGQSKMPFLPVHPYLSQPPMNDMRFMLPKEPKMESMPEPGLNLSPSSSLYQQLAGRLPLGPQM